MQVKLRCTYSWGAEKFLKADAAELLMAVWSIVPRTVNLRVCVEEEADATATAAVKLRFVSPEGKELRRAGFGSMQKNLAGLPLRATTDLIDEIMVWKWSRLSWCFVVRRGRNAELRRLSLSAGR